MEELAREYGKKKREIKSRLKEFKLIWNKPDRKIFSELCFCICTPQSKATYCDKAISNLDKNGTLHNGNLRQIKAGLASVRFPNNKAKYIIKARRFFAQNGKIKIKDKIDTKDIPKTRQWLTRHVTGIGLKETSHFLRNIGLGGDLAILDVHILKNMVRYKLIKEAPKSVTKKRYLDLEDRLRKFSKKMSIPMEELDLLFWSLETGQVFK